MRIIFLMTIALMIPQTIQAQLAPAEHIYDELLSIYVDEKGWVNYAGLRDDGRLDTYLDHLAQTNPENLSSEAQLALWINAYNAYTLKLILDSYPVGSIREITPIRIKGWQLAVPKLNSPFEYKLANVGGVWYSLDAIEHQILRKEFNEPRLHFAIVCASFSCPPLRAEIFQASRLNEQLNDQAIRFLTDPTKNIIPETGNQLHLSKIFKWFGKDFSKDRQGLQHYLATFFEGETQRRLANADYKISFLPYDWSLNEQSHSPAVSAQ